MTREPVLRVPWGLGERLRALLHPEPFQERFAFAVARPLRTERGAPPAAMVEQLLTLAPEDYDHTSAGGLRLTDAASARLNRWAVQVAHQGWLAVHLHSHPSGVDQFSTTDDEAESSLSHWLAEHNVPSYWSLVWPTGGVPRVRLWTRGKTRPGRLFLGLAPMVAGPFQDGSQALDRQRAFGPGLRAAADQILVGVLGVGGLGMLVVEQLARAGFRRFVLVDPDTVEETNLNRLPGVTRSDLGRLKVRVAKRLIRQAVVSLDLVPEICGLPHDVYRSSAAQHALARCDLILAVTDNDLSRTLALQLALDHGREYLQAGTDITLDKDGAIIGLRAEVTGAEIGRYCPICSGRLSPGQASIEARTYAGGEVAARALSDGYVPDVAAPAVMSLNAVTAGLLVTEIQRRTAGLGVRDLLQVDLHSGATLTRERLSLGTDCQVCGAVGDAPAVAA